MSPEQCSGMPINGKSDIYSLGAVLFYLLEGKPLYKSRNVAEIIKMHTKKPIPNIKRPITSELAQFVYKMLSKNPEIRPDALEVINKMEFFMTKES
jgi:serine/threonine-protein kinase